MMLALSQYARQRALSSQFRIPFLHVGMHALRAGCGRALFRSMYITTGFTISDWKVHDGCAALEFCRSETVNPPEMPGHFTPHPGPPPSEQS